MTIDWNKPVQTRDGRKVRILCQDAKSRRPIVGLITGPCGEETMDHWPPSGSAFERAPEHDDDLINVPEERFVNVYRRPSDVEETGTEVYPTRDKAQRYGHISSDYVGTYRLVPA